MVDVVFSDVDGVLTDSCINIGDNGEIFKSFDVKDGYGIVKWNDHDNREFVIVTSRSSAAVEHRATEIGIDEVHQGVTNKRETITQIAERLEADLDNAAYIGDDVSDVEAMKAVGTACCPADAVSEVRSECSYITPRDGGHGAVRDILGYLEKSSKTVLGVIPARYGSTRLPGKPLVELDGKAMIQHVYERANRADLLDELVVATDDEQIVETVEAVDGTAVLTDPDHATGTDRVAEIAAERGFDFTINIQGDEPLIDPDVIDTVVQALRENHPNVATPISPIDDSALLEDKSTVKVVTDADGRALYFSRSRIPANGTTEDAYKHIGLYGFNTGLLLDYVDMESDLEAAEDLEQLRLLENGYEIQTVRTDYDAAEVNVESDIPIVEKQLRQERENET